MLWVKQVTTGYIRYGKVQGSRQRRELERTCLVYLAKRAARLWMLSLACGDFVRHQMQEPAGGPLRPSHRLRTTSFPYEAFAFPSLREFIQLANVSSNLKGSYHFE
jgi:hypothetical protein